MLDEGPMKDVYNVHIFIVSLSSLPLYFGLNLPGYLYPDWIHLIHHPHLQHLSCSLKATTVATIIKGAGRNILFYMFPTCTPSEKYSKFKSIYISICNQWVQHCIFLDNTLFNRAHLYWFYNHSSHKMRWLRCMIKQSYIWNHKSLRMCGVHSVDTWLIPNQ